MWTSTAVASERGSYNGRAWRVVEAQHRISTARIARSSTEQAILEDLAEEVKPRLPVDAAGLDYLLASPFRYGHTQASRFRRAEEKLGIFYASEAEPTAIAETAYWRLRFFSRSPGLSPPQTTSEHTSFSVKVATARALDLTAKPFAAEEHLWTHPSDYTACQNLATEARKAGIELIRTLSARDPSHGCNIVLLAPSAFAERKPKHGKTWHMRFEANRLIVLAAFPHRDSYTFAPESFGFPASA